MGRLPVSRHGYGFITPLLVFSFLSMAFFHHLLYLFGPLTILMTFFFRDPRRSVPNHDSLVISPADGRVTSIAVVDSPLGDGTRLQRIAVFLNVFNVHVNRTPVTGVVKSVEYKTGAFLSALNDDSVVKNQMIRTVFKSQVGNHTVLTEQLAGIIARRVVCDLKPGDSVKLGSRMGIIKFGSRVNIFLPLDVKPLVSKGHKVVGGETILAHLDHKLPSTEQVFNYCKL